MESSDANNLIITFRNHSIENIQMQNFTSQAIYGLIVFTMFLASSNAQPSLGAESSAGEVSSSSSTMNETNALPAGKYVIDVEKLHCATCAKKLSRKLYAVKGVTKVETYVKKNQAVVYLPIEQAIEPKTLWLAALAGGTKPTELHYLDQIITADQMKQLLEAAEATTDSEG